MFHKIAILTLLCSCLFLGPANAQWALQSETKAVNASVKGEISGNENVDKKLAKKQAKEIARAEREAAREAEYLQDEAEEEAALAARFEKLKLKYEQREERKKLKLQNAAAPSDGVWYKRWLQKVYDLRNYFHRKGRS